MRFLFTTLQYVETDFYARVGRELERRGHQVTHVIYSRRAALVLRRAGVDAYCLPDEMARFRRDPLEVSRIEHTYGIASLRDVYWSDPACQRRAKEWCVERTVRHFLALERLFDQLQPDVVVPEVGNETIRTATHLIGLHRGIPVLFLFYTIFPRPLRLYRDRMDGRIVEPEDLRGLTSDERAEVERFIARFTARARPIRPYRRPPIGPSRARHLGRHMAVRILWDRDNEYLRPLHWTRSQLFERARALAARPLYHAVPSDRPFLYFPLHVADDYKIKRLVPHLTDQAAIVEQIAQALPDQQELVVKEHPMSIGRNALSMLRRLRRMPNVRLVEPHTSSHQLITRAQAVVVISSTVGLEALLYSKPVVTLGAPFYAGLGLTVDADSPLDLPELVQSALDFRPERERVLRFLHAAMRRCYPGAPALVDRSDHNAVTLAGSLDQASRELVPLATG